MARYAVQSSLQGSINPVTKAYEELRVNSLDVLDLDRQRIPIARHEKIPRIDDDWTTPHDRFNQRIRARGGHPEILPFAFAPLPLVKFWGVVGSRSPRG